MELEWIKGHVTSPLGFRASACYAGIRASDNKRPDLALIVSDVPCSAAAVFTRNVVKAAPLHVSAEHVASGKAQAIIVNSRNANCCTDDSMAVAKGMCKHTAAALGIATDDVLVASTGVIGEPLPLPPIAAAIPQLVATLDKDGGAAVATAILTTDTCEKTAAVRLTLGGKTVTIGAIAKGSGMIHPNMGTMLAFITTDAAISATALKTALTQATDLSFNMVSVDGDTSTNDTVAILASGLADNPLIDRDSADFACFVDALTALSKHLAKTIAADGEGSSKLLTCRVQGATSLDDARACARSVVSSSLFKAALFGSDANWGRILCAAGYSGATFAPEKVDIRLTSDAGEIDVCRAGGGLPFDEEKATAILKEKEVTVHIDLGLGEVWAEAYGCDLTYDYVRINGDYRS